MLAARIRGDRNRLRNATRKIALFGIFVDAEFSLIDIRSEFEDSSTPYLMKISAFLYDALLARTSGRPAGVGEFITVRHQHVQPGDPAAAVGQTLY
jgi:hypothetical protein